MSKRKQKELNRAFDRIDLLEDALMRAVGVLEMLLAEHPPKGEEERQKAVKAIAKLAGLAKGKAA